MSLLIAIIRSINPMKSYHISSSARRIYWKIGALREKNYFPSLIKMWQCSFSIINNFIIITSQFPALQSSAYHKSARGFNGVELSGVLCSNCLAAIYRFSSCSYCHCASRHFIIEWKRMNFQSRSCQPRKYKTADSWARSSRRAAKDFQSNSVSVSAIPRELV